MHWRFTCFHWLLYGTGEQSSEFSESEEDPLTSQLVHMDEIMLQDILEHCFLPGVQLVSFNGLDSDNISIPIVHYFVYSCCNTLLWVQ